ncbi:MAG: SDR family oxidoreductase [Burkholderiales bacterium]|nr:SDR family oxidoreductase [Burkholderiales bacterium]
MARLPGRIALITGAGSGIGLATAELFAREGAKVVLVGRNEAALADATTRIGKELAVPVVADVSRPEDNARMVQTAIDRFGGLDIFIANAGIEGATTSIETYPIETFDEVMAINVRGVFLGLKYAIPALRQRGGGSIVITSSIGGIRGRGQGNSAYIASKHAEIGLMRTATMECAPHNIRVNAVLPGPTETRMMRSLEESRSPGDPAKARAALVNAAPLRRYGAPEEIANVMLFLASDEASLCTGGVYSADGGFSAT